ncbi:hypothetical protein [[Mycoplasma] collis]|uniref:hypothetical protein n=1 Tax=[Mycoplasma] collis TaxID=2127 RepID=UPI000A693AEC|nr:hypothetical protein [[Mycoplasma] collis]
MLKKVKIFFWTISFITPLSFVSCSEQKNTIDFEEYFQNIVELNILSENGRVLKKGTATFINDKLSTNKHLIENNEENFKILIKTQI